MTIIIWDYNANKIINILKGHKDSIWDLCSLRDYNFIASCTGDGKISIWNWNKGYFFVY